MARTHYRRTMAAGAAWLVLASAGIAAAQAPAARAVALSFDADGRVNLAAQNVPVRDVLAEWARQCGCFIVNADRLPGVIDVPVEFAHAAQSDVLASLLRQAAGYVLTPKRSGDRGISNYETIYIVPTSNPVASAYVPPPVPPAGANLPTRGAPDDEIPPVTPIAAPGTVPEPPVPAPTPASSNPFGSRTSQNPFTTPGAPSSSSGAPGAPAAPPPAGPGGRVVTVPIVPVGSQDQR